jgi:hypothetical protein
MKKAIFLFAFFALAMTSTEAFAQPAKAKITTVGGPMLSPDKTEHNFGTIKTFRNQQLPGILRLYYTTMR